MSTDPGLELNSTAASNLQAPARVAVNWDLHRRLRTEARPNLLFRLSAPLAEQLPNDYALASESRPNVLPFVSRAEHLAWRRQWKLGRWVIRSPTPAFRDAILRQDEIFRQADAMWAQNHGPIPGGAKLVRFPQPHLLSPPAVLSAGGANGS